MKRGPSSFDQFAARRFRLAGKALIENGHPWFVPVDALERRIENSGKRFISFAHYDYLSHGRHEAVVEAQVDALHRFGTGAGASRLVGGERLLHQALERELAEFVGVEGALAMISGYLTNSGLIPHLLGSNDAVITDELAHNSIMVGSRSGRFTHITFRHNDLDHLAQILREMRTRFTRVLIAVDGLYSMDGDIVDLPRLLELKERHDAWLLLDEAHSFGVLGRTGRGLAEHFGVDPSCIELIVGTLSKAFATSGGFVCATSDVIEWLRFTVPGFVYSVGLSPATVAGARAALRLLDENPARVARLRANSRLFLSLADRTGLNTGSAIGEGVVPILFDSPDETMAVSDFLLSQGIYAPPIIHIGVPKNLPRIRFFISAGHNEEEIESTIAATAAARLWYAEQARATTVAGQ